VTRNVETVNGDISLREGTTVGGDVIVRETHGSHRGDREDWEPLKIMIEGGSVVRGNVIVEDSDRRVEVHLRDGGRVQGRVQNAKVIQD